MFANATQLKSDVGARLKIKNFRIAELDTEAAVFANEHIVYDF